MGTQPQHMYQVVEYQVMMTPEPADPEIISKLGEDGWLLNQVLTVPMVAKSAIAGTQERKLVFIYYFHRLPQGARTRGQKYTQVVEEDEKPKAKQEAIEV